MGSPLREDSAFRTQAVLQLVKRGPGSMVRTFSAQQEIGGVAEMVQISVGPII